MSAVKSSTLVRELIARGFSASEALSIEAGEKPAASSAAAPAVKPAPVVPDFIKQFAINRAARRALAKDLRAKGINPTGAAWAKAKKAAKIA